MEAQKGRKMYNVLIVGDAVGTDPLYIVEKSPFVRRIGTPGGFQGRVGLQKAVGFVYLLFAQRSTGMQDSLLDAYALSAKP